MKFLSALFFSLLISTTAFAQHNPVYSGSTGGGGGGGGATTSSAGVTRPTNTSDSFAVGAGSSGTAPLFFNPTTGQLEINVAGGGVVADADATLGGTLVLQEGADDGTESFTIGVTDAGLASSYTCTLQSDGTFLPANCPFNAAAGSTLAGLSDTTISGTPTTNHVLTYTGSTWEPQAAAGGSSGAPLETWIGKIVPTNEGDGTGGTIADYFSTDEVVHLGATTGITHHGIANADDVSLTQGTYKITMEIHKSALAASCSMVGYLNNTDVTVRTIIVTDSYSASATGNWSNTDILYHQVASGQTDELSWYWDGSCNANTTVWIQIERFI